MKTTAALIFAVSMLFVIPADPVFGAGPVDNSIYTELLKKHVKNGRVNYDGFKSDENKLDDYLAVLSKTDIKSLSRNEQFAFYINAYNAFTIKLILSKYPGINSIKELGGFFKNPWQIKFISMQGRTVTLDYIEHDVLRPRFKDPRVHFAINCASKSCPKLRSEPYESQTLEQQLEQQTRQFINDQKHNFIKDGTLYLSKIFRWFKEDFNDNPIGFVRLYADPPLKSALEKAGPGLNIKYLAYDWSLNR